MTDEYLTNVANVNAQKQNIFEKVNEECKELDERFEDDDCCLAVHCDRAFVVSCEKAEEFKNMKPNLELKKKREEIREKFRVNNLVQEGPVLTKTIKPNKK